ncbi:hypothetical protein [Streptomyces sp. NPDC059452]|uniref:hypothetical protein n=1 Tax=Streptomyces sp. NPDC059452 TaxID=3346835 RepID=UPI0036ADD9E5
MKRARKTKKRKAKHPGRRRFVICAGWVTGALVFLGITVYVAISGSIGAGLAGESRPVRVMECETRSGGKGGDQIWCAVRPVEAGDAGGLGEPMVHFGRQPGKTADVARTPWGEWVEVEPDLLSRAGLLLFPAIPLLASGVCAWLAVGALRPSEF